jgi:hypothetical protein
MPQVQRADKKAEVRTFLGLQPHAIQSYLKTINKSHSLAARGQSENARELVAFFVAGRQQWHCVAGGEKG